MNESKIIQPHIYHMLYNEIPDAWKTVLYNQNSFEKNIITLFLAILTICSKNTANLCRYPMSSIYQKYTGVAKYEKRIKIIFVVFVHSLLLNKNEIGVLFDKDLH